MALRQWYRRGDRVSRWRRCSEAPTAQFGGHQTYHIGPEAADVVSEVLSSAFGPILAVRVNQVRCPRNSKMPGSLRQRPRSRVPTGKAQSASPSQTSVSAPKESLLAMNPNWSANHAWCLSNPRNVWPVHKRVNPAQVEDGPAQQGGTTLGSHSGW